MKNYYLLLVLFMSYISFGQTACDESNSYLVNAYSHVKDAYDSNNIDHLKYYSNRSVESFKLSKNTLSSCDCQTALDLADEGIELLAKVEYVETFEDGRFYVKRARDISKKSVIEIDKCTAGFYNSTDVTAENDELSNLQNEQLRLKQRQDALKLKEEQIKMKLAEQKEKELALKKKQLILSYKTVASANIKTYNETLKVCDCNHEALKDFDESIDLLSQSIEDIKHYYNTSLKKIASNYLSQLEICNN